MSDDVNEKIDGVAEKVGLLGTWNDPRPANERCLFKIHGEANEDLVSFFADGHVEFGPTYTKEEAARVFWQSLYINHSLYPENEKLKADLKAQEEWAKSLNNDMLGFIAKNDELTHKVKSLELALDTCCRDEVIARNQRDTVLEERNKLVEMANQMGAILQKINFLVNGHMKSEMVDLKLNPKTGTFEGEF